MKKDDKSKYEISKSHISGTKRDRCKIQTVYYLGMHLLLYLSK